MKRFIKVGIKDLPFFLLLINLGWLFLAQFNIYSFDHWWILELTSHSLSFVGFMAFYAYLHRYCIYSWVCIGGLGMLNLVNLMHYFLNFNYLSIYMAVILITSLIFAIIFKIKKNESVKSTNQSFHNSSLDV